VFLLHDGPPYANGVLHLGHALNKILKDIINRYRILKGNRIFFVPGWDCHGLPTEMKALEQLISEWNPSKNNGLSSIEEMFRMTNHLKPLDIRRQAKKVALEAIECQKSDFETWAILGSWDRPYLTMDGKYEAHQIGIFWELFRKGLVYRDYKPVYWSPSSQTALAEAELEYPETHFSKSAYVKLRLSRKRTRFLDRDPVYIVVWTTTPWTLVANKVDIRNIHPYYV
jgi:isoleucyl-tRNA synthetase